MKAILSVLLLCLLSVALPPAVLAANQDPSQPNNLLSPESGEREPPVSRRQASDIARDSFPGKVLSIRLEGNRWRVRMDENGTVFNVFVDSNNGRASRSTEQD
jgi:uncharacterized membrane protein YkoI